MYNTNDSPVMVTQIALLLYSSLNIHKEDLLDTDIVKGQHTTFPYRGLSLHFLDLVSQEYVPALLKIG